MAFAAVSNAFAGGLLTNTNQNAAFVRNFAQEGKIDITSIYANPAGGAFLENGWHLSLNNQTAFQQRNIETTFPLFQYNTENPNTTHRFEGKATAPVIPSFTVSYNKDKWSVSAHFAICGGGGMCKFDNGLGSFEAAYAGMIVPMMQTPGVLSGLLTQGLIAKGYDNATASALAATGQFKGYSVNSFMKGKSYHFGLQHTSSPTTLQAMLVFVEYMQLPTTTVPSLPLSPIAFRLLEAKLTTHRHSTTTA